MYHGEKHYYHVWSQKHLKHIFYENCHHQVYIVNIYLNHGD